MVAGGGHHASLELSGHGNGVREPFGPGGHRTHAAARGLRRDLLFHRLPQR